MTIKNKLTDIILAIDSLILFVVSILISINLWQIVQQMIDDQGVSAILTIPVIVILLSFVILLFISSFVFIPFCIYYIKNIYEKNTISKLINNKETKYINFPATLILFVVNIIIMVVLFCGLFSLIPSTIQSLTEEFSFNNLLSQICLIIFVLAFLIFMILMEIYLVDKFNEERILKLLVNNKDLGKNKLNNKKNYLKAIKIVSIIISVIVAIMLGSSLVTLIKDSTNRIQSLLFVILFIGLLIYFVTSIFFL